MKRVHILSTVNAGAVSKSGSTYTIRGVCGAIDQIVMNRMLYPAEQLAAGVASLEGKPAPAGHPKDAEGRYISALNGEALFSNWIGSYTRNARHEGGRTLVDIVVNEAQAKAHPDGQRLVERLDAAISGNNAEPIHVSTGLYCEPLTANGESGGKAYDRIATQIRYDHLAILLNERGAATPEEGVGMFLNAAGAAEPVEAAALSTDPEDRRSAGLMRWVRRLLGNSADDLSFSDITERLHEALPEGAWLREVFDKYAIWCDRDGRCWRDDYAVRSDGSVAFAGTAVEVRREVRYEPITNHQEDRVKQSIIAALNAAGIKTEGMDDSALLDAYNAHVRAPVEARLTAANAKIAEHEQAAATARNAERDALAAKLATNAAAGSLSVDDYKAMPIEVLRKLDAANTTAAPVLPAGGAPATKPGDEFQSYSLNAVIDAAAGVKN